MLKILKHLTVVQEIIIIVAIPMLILYFILGSNIKYDFNHLQDANQVTELIYIEKLVGELTTSIRNERYDISNTLIAQKNNDDPSVFIKKTDDLIAQIEAQKSDQKNKYSQDVQLINDIFSSLEQCKNELATARTLTKNNCTDLFLFLHAYFLASDAALNILQNIPKLINDGIGSRHFMSYAQLQTAIDQETRLRILVSKNLLDKSMDQVSLSKIIALKTSSLEHLDVFSDMEEHFIQEQLAEAYKSPSYTQSLKFIESLITESVGTLKDSLLISNENWLEIQNNKVLALEKLFATVDLRNSTYTENLIKDKKESIVIAVFLMVMTMAIISYLSYLSISGIKEQFATLENSLGAIATGDLRKPIPLDGTDEFGTLARSINENLLKNTRSEIGSLGEASSNINRSTSELAAASKEILTTSNQQSAGVKEVVSTMEDTDQLSKQIAVKMDEVNTTVSATQGEIAHGFEKIHENETIMETIRTSSDAMIEGIKILSQQISSIWEIVNIINSIADQTKIIAFNAELEASSAGDAGKNFQIVATEIRRLADNTVTSTDEIRKKISEIQRSSDQLIVKAEDGTSKVQMGWAASQELKKIFQAVKIASEKTVDTSQSVSNSVQQQVQAFEQILLTMKQISEGINNFISATTGMSSLSENLQVTSRKLEGIVNKYTLPIAKQ